MPGGCACRPSHPKGRRCRELASTSAWAKPPCSAPDELLRSCCTLVHEPLSPVLSLASPSCRRNGCGGCISVAATFALLLPLPHRLQGAAVAALPPQAEHTTPSPELAPRVAGEQGAAARCRRLGIQRHSSCTAKPLFIGLGCVMGVGSGELHGDQWTRLPAKAARLPCFPCTAGALETRQEIPDGMVRLAVQQQHANTSRGPGPSVPPPPLTTTSLKPLCMHSSHSGEP